MNFKMRYIIVGGVILVSIISSTGETVIPCKFENHKTDTLSLEGDWQFFDTDSSYNEMTVSERFVFKTCEECGDPERMKFTQKLNTLTFSNGETWIIKTFFNNSVEIIKNKNIIVLYLLSSEGTDNVKSFYEWMNDPYRNGNGVMIFKQDMADRKEKLKRKINCQTIDKK